MSCAISSRQVPFQKESLAQLTSTSATVDPVHAPEGEGDGGAAGWAGKTGGAVRGGHVVDERGERAEFGGQVGGAACDCYRSGSTMR